MTVKGLRIGLAIILLANMEQAPGDRTEIALIYSFANKERLLPFIELPTRLFNNE